MLASCKLLWFYWTQNICIFFTTEGFFFKSDSTPHKNNNNKTINSKQTEQ